MRRKVYDSYDLSAKVADGRAQVMVDAIDSGDKFVNELDTHLEVIDPATSKVIDELPMAQTAAGRYTADFRIQKYGSYLLKAVHKRDGKTVAESLGSVALSYPLEYLRTTPDPEPLRHAAQVSGGHDQAQPAEVWDRQRREGQLHPGPVAVRPARRRSACSCSTSTPSASACSATGRSSSSSPRATGSVAHRGFAARGIGAPRPGLVFARVRAAIFPARLCRLRITCFWIRGCGRAVPLAHRDTVDSATSNSTARSR